MADDSMHIVIALRDAGTAQPPGNWQELIRGIDVLGSGSGRMQVKATNSALDHAREMLGHVLHFEESTPRSPTDASPEKL